MQLLRTVGGELQRLLAFNLAAALAARADLTFRGFAHTKTFRAFRHFCDRHEQWLPQTGHWRTGPQEIFVGAENSRIKGRCKAETIWAGETAKPGWRLTIGGSTPHN